MKKIILLTILSIFVFNVSAMNITNSFYMVSNRTPLSFSDVAAIAHFESRGNPRAISRTGAKGLYQFTSHTWNSLNNRYKLKFSKKPSFDIYEQTIMMIYLIKDNIAFLNRWKRKTGLRFRNNLEMIYLAHNCGAWNAFKIMQLDNKYTVDKVVSKWILEANKPLYKCKKKYCNKRGVFKNIRKFLRNP